MSINIHLKAKTQCLREKIIYATPFTKGIFIAIIVFASMHIFWFFVIFVMVNLRNSSIAMLGSVKCRKPREQKLKIHICDLLPFTKPTELNDETNNISHFIPAMSSRLS